MPILETIQPVQAAPTSRLVLRADERRTLNAAVQRIVIDAPPDLLARIESRIATLAPHKIEEVISGLRLFGSAAAAFVSVRRLTPFHALATADQDRMLTAWGESALPQARTLFQLVRRLTLATHYADARTHAAIGYRGPLHPRDVAVAWEGPALLDGTIDADERGPVARTTTEWTRHPAPRPLPDGVVTAATFRVASVIT
ncbi:MAG: hypothetical protein H7099_09035, partial [Gemmatimonadaceae bacterium]|nr:hypothetical protein [Gemmatimonadaceae bacterium]